MPSIPVLIERLRDLEFLWQELLDLHRPYPSSSGSGELFCTSCSSREHGALPEPYPCATVDLIHEVYGD